MRNEYLINELNALQDMTPANPISKETAALLMICRRLDALEAKVNDVATQIYVK